MDARSLSVRVADDPPARSRHPRRPAGRPLAACSGAGATPARRCAPRTPATPTATEAPTEAPTDPRDRRRRVPGHAHRRRGHLVDDRDGTPEDRDPHTGRNRDPVRARRSATGSSARSRTSRVYPPEAANVPDVAKFGSVDVEKIVGLGADLVIAGGSNFNPPEAIAQLRSLGVPVVVLFAPDVATALKDIELMGPRPGGPKRRGRHGGHRRRDRRGQGRDRRALEAPRVFYELDATNGFFGPAPGLLRRRDDEGRGRRPAHERHAGRVPDRAREDHRLRSRRSSSWATPRTGSPPTRSRRGPAGRRSARSRTRPSVRSTTSS